MDQVKQNLTVWGNALVLMALSALLVANVAAMVLWAWMLVQNPTMAWSPWNAAAMCLCILTVAMTIRMMAR